MKVYFYDGILKEAPVMGCLPEEADAQTFHVDARYGPKENREKLGALANLEQHGSPVYVLTNSLLALSHTYGWDEEENHTNIYLWVEDLDKYVRIDDLTDKDIRQAHNIEKMYIAGAFDVD